MLRLFPLRMADKLLPFAPTQYFKLYPRMKSNASYLSCFVLIALCPIAAGESVSQHAHFEHSNAGALYSGSGKSTLVAEGFFSAVFQPFDSTLGVLDSFTINCNIGGVLSGEVGPLDAPATAEAGLGGTFTIAGSGFDGAGGGNGGGAIHGEPLDVSFAIPSHEKTLTVENAGKTYDPAILAAIQGDQPVEVAYTSSVVVSYSNVEDLSAFVEGTISLTYHYTTPGGGTEALTITAVIRDTAAETVSISWTSSSGKTYTVEASDSLGSWTVLDAAVNGASDTTTFVETGVTATIPRRFYRVRENS
jgi:hypothetical protein